MILYTSYKNKLLILTLVLQRQETKEAVNKHAVKVIMPHLVKNLSREQNRKKKIKSCFEGTSKINIGLFCIKYMLYTNWLSIFLAF